MAVGRHFEIACNQKRAAKPINARPLQKQRHVCGHNAVGNPFGIRLSGWLVFTIWYGIYWVMTPTFGREMPPDLTEISLERTRQRGPQANDEQRKKENEVVHQRLHFAAIR